MNLVVKEYELEQDEMVRKGTRYIHYVDILTGKKYRPKEGLVVVGSDDVFEEVVVKKDICGDGRYISGWEISPKTQEQTSTSLNYGAPRFYGTPAIYNGEFYHGTLSYLKDWTPTINHDHTDLPSESNWTMIASVDTEMDKETFVMIVNAVEQNFGVMQDVKQLVQNVDGHTCGFDYLPDTMIKYLDEEMQTDLVSMYFFELELEIGTAEELYDFIIESRKCTCG